MTRSMPLPKYHSVYLVLKERLRDGRYDERLPGELDLMKEFGVSRVTVRKALENLAAEGLIERAAGRGTRPVRNEGTHAGTQSDRVHLGGLLDNLITASLATTIQVVECGIVKAPDPVAQLLALEDSGEVLRFVRVRRAKSGPVSHIESWVPRKFAKGLTKRKLSREAVLVLLEASGIKIGRASQTVSARQADATVAERLEVPLGSALLSVHRLVYDADDRPVLLLYGLYAPERYVYKMELSPGGAVDARVWVGNPLIS